MRHPRISQRSEVGSISASNEAEDALRDTVGNTHRLTPTPCISRFREHERDEVSRIEDTFTNERSSEVEEGRTSDERVVKVEDRG